MASFHPFSRLPTEIQDTIFSLSKPTTTTIHLLKDDFEIPSISPAPALLTTTHASRTTAQSWSLSTFPLWTRDDWQDIFFAPQDSILQLVVSASRAAALAITWTELHAVLGDALPAVQNLHIMCREPGRLVRLWMVPEGELVGVGESCVEKGVFGKDILDSDQAVREQLCAHLTVTVSTCTVEEIEQGVKGEVEVWKMGDAEREFFGVEAHGGVALGVQQLHDAAKISQVVYGEREKAVGEVVVPWVVDGDEEEAGERAVDSLVVDEVKGEGGLLTEHALRMLGEEMEKLFPAAEKGPREDPGGSVMPELD